MATSSWSLSLPLFRSQHVISIKPFVELYTPGLPRSVRLAFSAPGAPPPPPPPAPPAAPPLSAVAAVAVAVSASTRSAQSSSNSSSGSGGSGEDPLSDDLILQFGIFAMCLLLCSSSGINMFHLLSLHRAALLAPIVNVLQKEAKKEREDLVT